MRGIARQLCTHQSQKNHCHSRLGAIRYLLTFQEEVSQRYQKLSTCFITLSTLWVDDITNRKVSMIKRLFEKRDRWTFGIYRLENLADLFQKPIPEPIHVHREQYFRLSKSYQAVAADPFLFAHDSRLYCFYEVKTDHGHGTIHAKYMTRDGIWHSCGEVLKELFHLSYPQVLSCDGAIYMLPESAQSGSIYLYEAQQFPHHWRRCHKLLDAPLRDPTLIKTDDQNYYIFATTVDFKLKLYHSDSLKKQFTDTGIVVTQDRRFSRGAGSFITLGNQIFRPSQDCSTTYGKSIFFQIVERILPNQYIESPSGASLDISSARWMSRGCHHISHATVADSFFIALDGNSPDLRINSLLLSAFRVFEVLKK